jgi:hypothetical protein
MEPQETAVARPRLAKHGPVATNAHATIEESLDAVFSMRPRRIKYSVCSERIVGDYFFPESFVCSYNN